MSHPARRVVGLVPSPLAGAILLLTLPLSAQQSPSVRIDDEPNFANATGLRLAADGGVIHACWSDARAGVSDIRYSRSADAGGSWSANLRLDTDPAASATSEDPAIAVDGSLVAVAWEDRRNGQPDVYFNRSTDGGLTWLPADIRLDTGTAGATASIDIALAVDGPRVYCAWSEVDPLGGRTVGRTIEWSRSTDSGSTWLSSSVTLNTDASSAMDRVAPRIAVSGTDVAVVWSGKSTGRGVRTGGVFANVSGDRGVSWLTTQVRVDASADTVTPESHQVAIAPGGVLLAVWEDIAGIAGVFVNRSNDAGRTWVGPGQRVDHDPTANINRSPPRIALSGPDVFVVWGDSRNGTRDVFLNRSTDLGSTWSGTDLRLDTTAVGTVSTDAVRVAALGNLVTATWRRAGVTGPELVTRSSADRGATWRNGAIPITPPNVNPYASEPTQVLFANQALIAWSGSSPTSLSPFAAQCALAFGAQPYGAGTAGAGGVAPSLTNTGIVSTGRTLRLSIDHGAATAAGFLAIGATPGSRISVNTLGIALLAYPGALLPLTTDAQGTATIAVPIPSVFPLQGVNLNLQALVLDANGPAGLAASQGLALWWADL